MFGNLGGIEFVPGIEITAVVNGDDLHVLGYFVDPDAEALRVFLAEQRRNRLARVRQMIDRLAVCGIRLDAASILQPAIDDPTKAVGRPSWSSAAAVSWAKQLIPRMFILQIMLRTNGKESSWRLLPRNNHAEGRYGRADYT